MGAKARALAAEISRELADSRGGNRPRRPFVAYVDYAGIFPLLRSAVVRGMLGQADRQIQIHRCAGKKVFLFLRNRHPKDWNEGVPTIEGIRRNIANLRIEQIGLSGAGRAIR